MVLANWHEHIGLDTGGANYRLLQGKILEERTSAKHVQLSTGSDLIDNCIHLSKASFRNPEELEALLRQV